MADWKEAMEEAKRELGYNEGEYIEDWHYLLQKTREIYEYEKEMEYNQYCEEQSYNAIIKHQNYLKSDYWRKLRMEILYRDNFLCQDCFNKAIDVHHMNYRYLGTDKEKEFCISLCRECHKRIHKR